MGALSSSWRKEQNQPSLTSIAPRTLLLSIRLEDLLHEALFPLSSFDLVDAFKGFRELLINSD